MKPNDFLDLENLEDSPEVSPSADANPIQDMVISAQNVAEKSSDFSAGTGQKLSDIYDRMMKLVFMFDTSGSMGDTIVDDDDLKSYSWDMAAIRRKIQNCVDEVANQGADNVGDDVLQIADLHGQPDNDIKTWIVGHGFTAFFGVYGTGRNPSKMQVVREMAIDEITKRIRKYNEADVRVLTFENNPTVTGGKTEKDLVRSVSSMNPSGGTNITAAVEAALKLCQKAPSKVNLHHLVLVSDGQDFGAVRVESLLPEMKRLGVVFDFIYISGGHNDVNDAPATEALKRVCAATGGEYVVVRKARDLRQKFITASERKCLPPPAGV